MSGYINSRVDRRGTTRRAFTGLGSVVALVASSTVLLQMSVCVPPPTPPTPEALVADAGIDGAIDVGDTIQLDAVASGGVAPYSFEWLQQSGPAQTMTPADGKAQSISVTGDAAGTAVFQVKVTDASGEQDTDTATVVVSEVVVPPTPGTYVFTVGVDNLVGSSADDTFVGTQDTYQIGDQADGGGGTDRLNLITDGTDLPDVDITNIENVYGRTTGNATIDMTNFDSSVAQVWADRNSANLTFDAIPTLATLGLDDISDQVDFNFAASLVSGDADAATLIVAGSDNAGSDTTITIPGIETLNVESNHGTNDNVLQGLTLADGEALNISGATDLEIVTDLPAAIATIDGSTATGGITLGSAGAADLSVTTGDGDDDITVTAGGGDVTADLGAGDDRIQIAGFDEDDTLAGGTGDNTLAIVSADAVAVSAALTNITDFQTLAITNALATGLNLTYFPDATTLVAEAGVAAGASTTVSSGDTVVLEGNAAGAMTLVITGNGTTDSVEIDLDDADIGGLLTLTGIESATIDSTGAANTIANITAAPSAGVAASTLVVTGDEDLDVGTLTTISSCNASAFEGNLTATLAASGALTGGTGDDTLTGSAAADTISGGDGDDTLDGAAAADAISGGAGDDTIDGGAGADVITTGDGSDTVTVGVAGQEDGDEITDLSDGDDVVDYNSTYLGGAAVTTFTAGTTVAALTVAADDDKIVLLSSSQTTAQLAAAVAGQAADAIVVAFDSDKGYMVIVADADWSGAGGRTVIDVTNITTLAEVTALTDGTVIN